MKEGGCSLGFPFKVLFYFPPSYDFSFERVRVEEQVCICNVRQPEDESSAPRAGAISGRLAWRRTGRGRKSGRPQAREEKYRRYLEGRYKTK